MTKDEDSKKRILKAALQEFSMYGLSGARMERIAQAAKVNKAMLFYYFASKEKLYQLVVREAFEQISPVLIRLLSSNPSAEEFLERLPELYVGVVSRNPEFIRMVALELIQNPQNITGIVTNFFKETSAPDRPAPARLIELIEKWKSENVITEEDPFQFMLNIISLSILSFLAKPFLEALFKSAPGRTASSLPGEDFAAKRIKSIVNLLKRGMLA